MVLTGRILSTDCLFRCYMRKRLVILRAFSDFLAVNVDRLSSSLIKLPSNPCGRTDSYRLLSGPVSMYQFIDSAWENRFITNSLVWGSKERFRFLSSAANTTTTTQLGSFSFQQPSPYHPCTSHTHSTIPFRALPISPTPIIHHPNQTPVTRSCRHELRSR